MGYHMIKVKSKTGKVHLSYPVGPDGKTCHTYCGKTVEAVEEYQLDKATLTCTKCLKRENSILRLRGN